MLLAWSWRGTYLLLRMSTDGSIQRLRQTTAGRLDAVILTLGREVVPNIDLIVSGVSTMNNLKVSCPSGLEGRTMPPAPSQPGKPIAL